MQEPWRTRVGDAVGLGGGMGIAFGVTAVLQDTPDPWLAALTGFLVGAAFSPLVRHAERKRQEARQRRRDRRR